MIIVNLHKSILADRPNVTYRQVTAELAKLTGIGICSVQRVLAEYKTTKTLKSPLLKRTRKKLYDIVGDRGRIAIGRLIHSFWLNREFPTVKKIMAAVSADENLPTLKRSSMYRMLAEMGFVTTQLKRFHLVTDKSETIVERRKYLREIRKYRDEGRTVYYLDETCCDVDDYDRSGRKIEPEQFRLVKDDRFRNEITTGGGAGATKGKRRLTVLHIGSRKGSVDGGLTFFEPNSAGDPDGRRPEINGDTFLEWFVDTLPRLDDRAVVVMDRAPHHSAVKSKCPTAAWKRADIVRWLRNQNIEFEDDLIRTELLHLVGEHKGLHVKYVVDEVAMAQDKVVLRLPLNHCGLNPMERVWSLVEDHVRSDGVAFDLPRVKQLLIDGMKRVTAQNWYDFEKLTIDEERRLWNVDSIMDEMMERMT